MTRCLLVALALWAGLQLGPGLADARAATAVGVGEQEVVPFASALWQDAGLRRTRFVVPWDVAAKPGAERERMDRFYREARLNGIEALVAFNPSAGSRCPRRPCRRPSARSFSRAFRAFRARYPGQRVIAAWNEANHHSQPTDRHPRAAATYYNIVRRLCRGCKVVAADVIDERGMVRWLARFRRYARRPRIWGLHNYSDTNPRRGQRLGGTRRFLRATRHGEVWLTETGGIVAFALPSGRTLYPYSEARAESNTSRMFKIAKAHRRRVRRLYIYHWQQSSFENRFDAGLLARDGSPRPAYFEVLHQLTSSRYFKR
jgi:hypothetical protein